MKNCLDRELACGSWSYVGSQIPEINNSHLPSMHDEPGTELSALNGLFYLSLWTSLIRCSYSLL